MSEKEYFRSHVAVHIILRKGHEILMGRRCNTKFGNGDYGMPAGHIDGNESASKAILRETQEEIGIVLKPEDISIAHVQHLRLPPREYINIYFIANRWSGIPEIKEPEKCDDLRWFSLEALPANISPNVRASIDHYKNGVFYSEFGWN